MLGTKVVVEALRSEGVDLVFGYPGGALIPIFDELYDCKDIRVILPRHEQGGVHAAEGYARASGRPGVMFATSGPGATNIVTGIADAFMDSVPLVCITGQVKTHLIGNDAFQEVDLTGVTRSISKHNYLVKDPEDLPRILKEAFHIATTGRPGPVVIDLPVDIQKADIKAKLPKKVDIVGYSPKLEGNPRQIKRAGDMINNAQRPVLYVGGGVITSGCSHLIKQMAVKGNIPVTTTLNGLGAFPSDHLLSLHMLGMHGTAYANYAVTHSDVLIAVGARFDDRVTGKLSAFAPNAKIIHIDIDPTSVSKNVPVDIPLVGDAGKVLKPLITKIKKQPRKEWLVQIAGWKKSHPLTYSKKGLRPQHIIEELSKLTRRRKTIICTEVGQHQMWAALFSTFTAPRRWISSGGLGTMGFGLPAAMGAQLAKPDHLVWNIAGDGSIQMNIQELNTICNHKLPVKTLILNNGYLGMVRQWQELFFDKRYAQTDLYNNPDFVKVAEAYGIKALRITKRSQVVPVLKKAIAHKGPVVIDAVVEREENVFPMVPAGEAIDRMIGGMA